MFLLIDCGSDVIFITTTNVLVSSIQDHTRPSLLVFRGWIIRQTYVTTEARLVSFREKNYCKLV